MIDLDDVDISKYNFSIDDLDNEKSKNHDLLKKILDSSSACQVSDAYSSVSGRSGVIDGLKPMNDNKVYGKIFTAKTNTDDWGTSLMAMDNAEEGEVLFIYTYGKPVKKELLELFYTVGQGIWMLSLIWTILYLPLITFQMLERH